MGGISEIPGNVPGAMCSMAIEIDAMSVDAGAVCFGHLPHRLTHALGLRDAGVSAESFIAEMDTYDRLKEAAEIVSNNEVVA